MDKNYELNNLLNFGKQDPSCCVLDERIIDVVDSIIYLGIVLSSSGSIAEDVRRAQTTFNRGFGCFIRQFHSVELEVTIKIFNSVCRPIYGAGTMV